jgi:ATP/maltotriose-dependent transcriptional regulator MalT
VILREVIDQALAAEDVDRAAGLIEREAEPALMSSEMATLLKWICRAA